MGPRHYKNAANPEYPQSQCTNLDVNMIHS
jgi:hypothetical protein